MCVLTLYLTGRGRELSALEVSWGAVATFGRGDFSAGLSLHAYPVPQPKDCVSRTLRYP